MTTFCTNTDHFDPEIKAVGQMYLSNCVLPCDFPGFCGTPKTVPHASLKKDNDYSLGQVLYFKCQAGYDKRPPISGTRTCKKVNGKNIWTPLNMRCTNDSSIRDEWLSPVTEPGKVFALASHRCDIDLFTEGPHPTNSALRS